MRPSIYKKLGVGLVTAALVASAAPAWAQGGGGGGSGSGGGSRGGSGGSGSGGLGGSSVQGNTETSIQAQNPSLAGGFSGSVTARQNSVSSANFLQQYYINPFSQGVVQGSQQTPTLSFGQPVFNISGSGGSSGFGGSGGGTAGGRSGGSSFGGASSGSFGGTSSIGGRSGGGGGSSGGAFGSSFGGGSQGFGGMSGSSIGGTSSFGGIGGSSGLGGIGGRTGAGGLGGTAGARSGSTNGIMTYTSTNFGPTNGVRSPNVVTTLNFQSRPVAGFTPVTPAARTAELQQVITRSTGFTVPAAVTVANDGPAVVLRGRVANDDERRLAENMLRLSGVREIRNELQVPATPAGNQ
jgi:BON domain